MNAWTDPDAMGAQEAGNMAAFLEERARAPEQQRLHAALVAALAPRPGERLLDLGCGTGVIARRLAEQTGAAGLVLGVDVSSTMLEWARARGDHPALRWEQGDGTALRYEAGSFDGASAAHLLLHVPEPLAVLTELRRVVRPGGRMALLDWDWGTLAIDHSDRALTRRILDWRCDHLGGDNWIGRKLVRLCQTSGWHVRDVQPLVSVARDEGTVLIGYLRRDSAIAAEQGIISAAEHQAWLGEIERRLAEGTFFATINDYLVVAD